MASKDKLVVTALAIILLPGPTAAGSGDFEAGLGVSTLGATASLSYGLTPSISVRALHGRFNASGTETVDDVNYTITGRLGGTGLLADYALGVSGFLLSGGAFVSNFEISGITTASPTNPVTIGGITLVGGETATSTIKFRNQIAPMVSIGYSRSWGSFSIAGEIGAIATGGLDVDVAATGVASADIDQEVQNIRNDLGDIVVYPYVALLAHFRF